MKFVLPGGLFALLLATSAFMRSVGYRLLSDVVPGFSTYVPALEKGLSVIVGLAGLWLANVVAVAVLDKSFAKVLKSSPLAKKLLPLLKYLSTVMIWAFGAFFLLNLAGVNVNALITGAGIGGLVFALASKELASNLFGSLSLIFGNFFKIHDRIRIKGFEGTVEEITLSYTRLTDKGGHVVFMPNKFLTAEPVENLTQSEFGTTEIAVMVAGAGGVSKAKSAVEKAVAGFEGAKAKVSVVELSGDATKVTLKLEAKKDDVPKVADAAVEALVPFVAK